MMFWPSTSFGGSDAMDIERRLTRRGLLGTGAGVAAGLAVSACSPSGTVGPGSGPTEPTGVARPPAYAPYKGPKPDLAGDGAIGIPNGFLSYPDPPPSTGRVPLALSKPVDFLVQGVPTP